jgi:hypothetical protein
MTDQLYKGPVTVIAVKKLVLITSWLTMVSITRAELAAENLLKQAYQGEGAIRRWEWLVVL